MQRSVRSFAYIATKESHTLILGSMPGVKSLDAAQYYAHPQNAFWKIMGRIFAMPVEDYTQRIALICENNLALWVVLAECERDGSLDSAISRNSIAVNDFAGFFRKHPRITRVFFNGSTAEAEFKKRVLPDLEGAENITFTRLPSTSPAHAGMTFEKKLAAWRVLRKA